jgi:hypothetical protein
MKAYSEVKVMAVREKYERTLADLENKFLDDCFCSAIVIQASLKSTGR